MPELARSTFTTSRALEYFSEAELNKQMGATRREWPIALLKELLDNALDACEGDQFQPHISVTVKSDEVIVTDNGPGLSEEVITGSLDYNVRISDKTHYVSPSRGQQGNALKTLWAAPYVACGGEGGVTIEAHGIAHHIVVTADHIRQEPVIDWKKQPSDVKNGTRVTLCWPNIASYLENMQPSSFYVMSALELVTAFAIFNPHATIIFNDRILQEGEGNKKWTSRNLPSAHWYDGKKLAGQIRAYLAEGKDLSVRQFLALFAGLVGTQKQAAVCDTAGISSRASLSDLLTQSNALDDLKVQNLLDAMQMHSREIKPEALGAIGFESMLSWQLTHGVRRDAMKYQKGKGLCNGMPFVIEVAFGVSNDENMSLKKVIGLNWSATFKNSLPYSFGEILDDCMIERFDSLSLLVHISYPDFTYADKGKTEIDLQHEMLQTLKDLIRITSKDWTKYKKKIRRDEKAQIRDYEQRQKRERSRQLSVKDAAYQVMENAYNYVSDNGRLPANARQIMYAARPMIIELTGKSKPWKESSYFTQVLLPDFLKEHSEYEERWDVVYDARGKIVEPHTGRRVDLGTLQVRQYLDRWNENIVLLEPEHAAGNMSSSGPSNRYGGVLFVEKEGFDSLLKSGRVAEKYDIAIMSTKGMSVVAARSLVASLSERGIPTYVLRDFDKSGFSIAHTLCNDTRRFQFTDEPKVIDLGLRLEDVEQMQLQSEEVSYPKGKDPRKNLAECGATEAEQHFLVSKGEERWGWRGHRVELNAMDSRTFLNFIDRKLQQHGVQKVVPDHDTLAQAYVHACKCKHIQEVVQKAMESWSAEAIQIPEDLESVVHQKLIGTTRSWDDVVQAIANQG